MQQMPIIRKIKAAFESLPSALHLEASSKSEESTTLPPQEHRPTPIKVINIDADFFITFLKPRPFNAFSSGPKSR